MKNVFYTLLLMVSLVSCGKEEVTEPVTGNAEMKVINSLADYESSIKSGVSLMFFHATWCSICKTQRPNVEGLLSNTSLRNVKFGEVDKDKNKAISDKFQVIGQPVIVIYKDNVERERLSGIHTKEHLTELLQKLNP